jgi:hypothetical protein
MRLLVFKQRSGLVLKGASAAAVALTVLSACSGLGMPSFSTGQNPFAITPLRILTSKDFTRPVKWGTPGAAARAECPSGSKVVAGGSASSNGSFIGTGYADGGKAWVVQPSSGVKGEAFASCVSIAAVGSLFAVASAKPINGLAVAQCGSGFILITGYGRGGPITRSWFEPTSYWVRGGATAYASCVRSDAGVMIKHAWNRSQHPKVVYAGCGGGNAVIAGSMGNSEWPGPPIQSRPGVGSGPGVPGYDGWWSFSNAANQLTWAACVKI